MSDELNAAALSEIASFLNNEHQDSLLAIGRGLVAVDTVWAELSHVANDHCSIRVGIGNTVEEHRCMASRCRRLGVGVSVSASRKTKTPGHFRHLDGNFEALAYSAWVIDRHVDRVVDVRDLE